MKFRQAPREELELNLTPLIDVVFLLLIFFMVTTTFQKESEISLQLPRAADAPVEPVADRIEIVINAAGTVYVNDQELVQSDVESLQNALFQVSGGASDVPLTIRADAQTSHQSFVTALDAAAKLGMNRVTIATTRAGD